MATKTKKAETTKATTKKKTETLKQIENLENALKDMKDEDIIDNVPEEIKEEVKADIETASEFGKSDDVEVLEEVKDIFEKAELPQEIQEQFDELNKSKAEFNEKIEKEPEKTEEIVKAEIKKMGNLKKKAESMRAALLEENKKNISNEGFTNWWNGSSSLY
jgi:hypothetical protein